VSEQFLNGTSAHKCNERYGTSDDFIVQIALRFLSADDLSTTFYINRNVNWC